jgi:CRP-like cAMP-binding protein
MFDNVPARGNASLSPDADGRAAEVPRQFGGVFSLERVRNNILRGLPPESYERLQNRLERVPLKRRQVLHERNLPVSHAYFIERGLVSMLARSENASLLEVGTMGRGDFAGLPLVLGTGRTPHRCVVQVPGEAMRISAGDLAEVLDEVPALRRVLLRYVQASSVQSTQLVVCNARHTIRQRLARWLLFALDRIDGNEVALTHQLLARALGVRRAGITTAMGCMEQSGLIARGRGRLAVLDRTGLEAEVCECYRAIRTEYGRVSCQEITSADRSTIRH